jgi:hypothetical protein
MTAGPRLSDDGQWWWTGAEWVRASQAPASPLAPIAPMSESDSARDAPEAPPVSESVAAAPVSKSLATALVSESVAAAPQPAPTPNLLGLAVTNRFIFWGKIAAIIVYVPALIVVFIAAGATPSGGNEPWYGNLAVAILLALALGGLLIDRRVFGSMGGIIKWNRMNGWQKGLVGFFYFLVLLPLGIGIFYVVSLLPRRSEAFADVAIVPATLPDVSGSPPNWAPTPSSSLPRSRQFSPDGTWFWDGTAWQPVPGRQRAIESMVRTYRGATAVSGCLSIPLAAWTLGLSNLFLVKGDAADKFAKDLKKLVKQGWSVAGQGEGYGEIIVTYTRVRP